MATVAPACRAALTQANALWPARNRASDGLLGDAAHMLRRSDHNDGNAFDITHDPAHGCDAHALIRGLVARRDPRVKMAISQWRIWTADRASEGWRRYFGVNGHTQHAHISIFTVARNDTSPWWQGGTNIERELMTLESDIHQAVNFLKDRFLPESFDRLHGRHDDTRANLIHIKELQLPDIANQIFSRLDVLTERQAALAKDVAEIKSKV